MTSEFATIKTSIERAEQQATELEELHRKYMAVLESCETSDQVMVCAQYANLVVKRIEKIRGNK